MRGLIRLAVVVGIAWFGYAVLWPRYDAYRREEAAEKSADDSRQLTLACLTAAESATSDFAREVGQFERAPVETALWATFLIRASGSLATADSLCRCPSEACLSAAAALLEQRKLLNRIDAVVRGKSPVKVDLSAGAARIEGLLARARAEAR